MEASAGMVVVGGGQAAGTVAEWLRRDGYEGDITILCEENEPPYQRPNLSKRYLAGQLDPRKLLHRPVELWDTLGITLRRGTRATAIDPGARRLSLADGGTLAYEGLALCTGAAARGLRVEGAGAEGVFRLRTRADADGLRAALGDARDVVCVGGGLISLESAGVLRAMGKQVTVLAREDRVLASVGTPEIAAFLHAEHARNGVILRTGASVARIETRAGRACAVITTAGERLPADVVLVAIGVEPETRLAETAGLACDNGIVVDEYARTRDPHIVAAGDCTRHPNAVLGRSLRLESVHNAVQQGKTAAATLAGRPQAYAQAPWFWSDQLGHRLQGVGLAPRDCQRIVRGDPASGRFAVWCFEGERLIGCQALDRPAEYMACRRMLDNAILPLPADVAHPRFDPEARLPRKAPLAFQRRVPVPA